MIWVGRAKLGPGLRQNLSLGWRYQGRSNIGLPSISEGNYGDMVSFYQVQSEGAANRGTVRK